MVTALACQPGNKECYSPETGNDTTLCWRFCLIVHTQTCSAQHARSLTWPCKPAPLQSPSRLVDLSNSSKLCLLYLQAHKGSSCMLEALLCVVQVHA